MGRYDDILHCTRPVLAAHSPMPRAMRAKQFMPFAALKGYEEIIAERQTVYEPLAELDEEQRAALDSALFRLRDALGRGERPLITAEFFEISPGHSDGFTAFGRYHTVTGTAEKISLEQHTLRISGRVYSLDDMTALWRENAKK